MGFHTNHTHHVMIMNKTQHAVLQNRGLNVKTDERKILYSSFRPLYLCTFASDKSCLTEIHRKLQNLRLLPSHYLSLWEKLISRLFLIYSYSNIVFYHTKPIVTAKNPSCFFWIAELWLKNGLPVRNFFQMLLYLFKERSQMRPVYKSMVHIYGKRKDQTLSAGHHFTGSHQRMAAAVTGFGNGISS